MCKLSLSVRTCLCHTENKMKPQQHLFFLHHTHCKHFLLLLSFWSSICLLHNWYKQTILLLLCMFQYHMLYILQRLRHILCLWCRMYTPS